MIGYPCDIGLSFIDMRIGSNIISFNQPAKTFKNQQGYMPVFRTIIQEERFKKERDFILLGAISNPSKITHIDIKKYDSILSRNPNTRLVYARLGKCYSEEKAKEILSYHSESTRGRVAVTNMVDGDYVSMINNFDMLLDTTYWNLHATMIDSISCGVPVLRMADHHINSNSSRLSTDVYNQIGVDADCASVSLDYYTKTGGRELIDKLSDALFNTMVTFDNSIAWTREIERGITEELKQS
jgi:predicted O-linked N-acetylglucosamine transferase (SPINDLY family)